jgi:hypothetical protein
MGRRKTMNNLPQLHDWFLELLTPGQWIFLYIVSWILIMVGFFWLIRKEEFEGKGGVSFALGMALPPFLFGAILVILNFLSFMIWLWNS